MGVQPWLVRAVRLFCSPGAAARLTVVGRPDKGWDRGTGPRPHAGAPVWAGRSRASHPVPAACWARQCPRHKLSAIMPRVQERWPQVPWPLSPSFARLGRHLREARTPGSRSQPPGRVPAGLVRPGQGQRRLGEALTRARGCPEGGRTVRMGTQTEWGHGGRGGGGGGGGADEEADGGARGRTDRW